MYSWWDNLMAEQGVVAAVDPGGPALVFVETNYNVGDVIIGELVEEGRMQ